MRVYLLALVSALFSVQTLAQSAGSDKALDKLKRDYASAVHSTVAHNWIKPEGMDISARCSVVVTQLPGGDVLDVHVLASCEYNEEERASVIKALYDSSPLPYRGYEYVFSRAVVLSLPAQ